MVQVQPCLEAEEEKGADVGVADEVKVDITVELEFIKEKPWSGLQRVVS